MATKAKPSFEKAINDLEKIVKALESGDLPLEKALKSSKPASSCLDTAPRRWTKPKSG
jgi:exodeoxyribonuclease VII small subunit